jgi:hypothetical protein
MTIIDKIATLVLSGAEKLREQSEEEKANTGHASADDADIDFDG